jgi:RNA polymerase sigma-70 factor (ECF subfamily)
MAGKAVSCGLIWDFAVSKSVDESQQWVLSAMQRHGQELVTMLWRILGNEQDVCDAYQDTFLRLAHYEGRRKPEHIKAYVFRTASNIAISMLRRKIVERRLPAAIANSKVGGGYFAKEAQNGNAVNSPANELDSKYLQQTLRCYLAQLPEHLRNVIMLRDLAELSYARIGAILSISASTARVYRCKALQLLAVWMNKERQIKQ